MARSRWFRAVAFVGACVPLAAQDPPEKTRILCDPEDPRWRCPGESCMCVPDTLEVTFDGATESVFEYETFKEGMQIDVVIVTDTVSEKVQGWSYGVAHDEEALQLLEMTIGGTAAEVALIGMPDVFFPAELETCGDDPECAPENRTPGGGFISAVVLSFKKPVSLEIRRNTIAKAKYALEKDVGPEGTLVRFTNRLAYEDTPPIDLNVTIGGRSKRWSTAVDGWIKRKGEASPFLRGDADGSGKVNILDAILNIQSLFGAWMPPADCDDALDANDDGKPSVLDALAILAYLFQQGPAFPAPFPGCEGDPTVDSLTCRESNCAER